jgi:ABC-type transport system involved in Fe-S cluster assembly fused permease/ATPase subunit
MQKNLELSMRLSVTSVVYREITHNLTSYERFSKNEKVNTR